MRDETKMDANRLITEVHKRPALWNQKHMSYHNRDVTNRIWMEIAAVFKLPKQVLKTKWKGLRDTFRAEIKKEVFRKTKYTAVRPAWIHYKTLQFLKDQMLPRPPIWERGNDAVDNEATSAEASEDSCGWIGNTTIDVDIGLVETNKPRETTMDNIRNISMAHRRVAKRIFSNSHRLADVRRMASGTSENASRDVGGVVKMAKASRNDTSISINSRNNRHTSKRDRRNIREIDDNANDNANNNNRTVNRDGLTDRENSEVKQEPVERNYDDSYESDNVASPVDNRENVESTLRKSSDEIIVAETAIGENCSSTGRSIVDKLDGNNRLDDNYYFLMSLLPHMRTLPAERCMLLRMQMQQMVYQEVYEKNRSS